MSHAGQSLQEANDFMRLEAPLLALLAQATAGMSPAVRLFTAADLAGQHGEIRVDLPARK